MDLRRCRATLVAALCVSLSEPIAVFGQTPHENSLIEQAAEHYEELAIDRAPLREQEFLARMLNASRRLPKNRKERCKLDLTPLANMAIAYLKEQGLPIVETRDEKKRPIAIAAEFALAEEMPTLKMHLGDRPAEALGAFYPPEKGFRFSVVYPMRQWSLRIEGGDDSELGSGAVAGVTWVAESKRYAWGFGLPMKIKHTRGDFGVIFQFRMNLD